MNKISTTVIVSILVFFLAQLGIKNCTSNIKDKEIQLDKIEEYYKNGDTLKALQSMIEIDSTYVDSFAIWTLKKTSRHDILDLIYLIELGNDRRNEIGYRFDKIVFKNLPNIVVDKIIFYVKTNDKYKPLINLMKERIATRPETSLIKYKYDSVAINKDLWMTSNLTTDRYRNGDYIGYAKTKEEWNSLSAKGLGCWCYYNYDSSNQEMGKLYNWFAVDDPRQLAPIGWHISTSDEWDNLIEFLGTKDGINNLKDYTLWEKSPKNTEYNRKNSVGFNALASGVMDEDGDFIGKGYYSYWWSPNKDYKYSMAVREIRYDSNKLISKVLMYPNTGLSIRCVKNK